VAEKNVHEPTVSVIVPVLNAELTIKNLLDSLVKVDYDKGKLEVILVDGGSIDGTREIIGMYPVKLVLESRRGLNVARNTGLRNSRGEIVLFTDSDCVVPEDWVRKMVSNFEDAKVGCAGGNVSRYEETFLSRYSDESVMPVLRIFKKREVLDNVGLPLRYPAGCNMAFKRDAIDEVGGFDEDIQYGFDEDEFVERVCRVGYKMVLDPETTVRHQHRGAVTRLLRQTFNYGRGGGLLFRKKKMRDRIARYNLATLTSFLVWLAITLCLIYLTIAVNWFFIVPLLLLTLVPFLLLELFYANKAIKGISPLIVVTYPIIDILRFLAYCLGEIYGLTE